MQTPAATDLQTPAPSPDPWLTRNETLDVVLRDNNFARESRATCSQTQPANLPSLTDPAQPLDTAPTYQTVQMILADVVGPDGPVAELPGLDEFAWAGYARTYRGKSVVAGPSDIELLACVALRTGASADYVTDGIRHTVYKTAEVIWIVERASGVPVGGPWVLGGEYAADDQFPTFLSSSVTTSVGSLELYPLGAELGQLGEVAAGSIVAFLGR